MASPMLPSLDSLAAMASAAAAEAAAAVQERDRVPDPVLGWYGDGEAMRVSMPGALIRSTDGTRFFTVPIANAVKRNADGVKIRVADSLERYTPYYTVYNVHPPYSCTMRSHTVYNTLPIRIRERIAATPIQPLYSRRIQLYV